MTRDNPHLVTLLGSHVEADYAFLVLELMRGGDLGHAIPTDQHSMRWYGHGRHVALAVAQGLQGLHAKQVGGCCVMLLQLSLLGCPRASTVLRFGIWVVTAMADRGSSSLRRHTALAVA